jgi:hypothetical protein
MPKGNTSGEGGTFFSREEREGEEAQIPGDFELKEREQQQYWVDTHTKGGISKHLRRVSTFSSSILTTTEGGIYTRLIVVCTTKDTKTEVANSVIVWYDFQGFILKESIQLRTVILCQVWAHILRVILLHFYCT